MSNEYMRLYMKRRYDQRRADAIAFLGGACVDCGSVDELEFDHVDPALKSFTIGNRLASAPLEIIYKELKKCVLRCFWCHVNRSTEDQSVGHGQGASGKKNCPCAPCKARKREYMKNYYKNRCA